MSWWLSLILLIIASIVLVRTAAALVHSLAALAGFFRLSEFSVAFILMAVVTSLPEVLVGVSAAITGIPILSLGNVIGSNIADLTLIVALPVLLAGGLPVRSILARRDTWYMFVFALAPIVLLLDKTLSRLEAVILLVFYLLYVLRLLQQRTRFSGFANHVEKKVAVQQVGVFAVAILFLVGSSQLVVFAAKGLAVSLDVPVALIGLFVVAVGTSLPELAFGLKAVELKHSGQILGNLLGSVVANSTLVLAITSLISPIQVTNLSLVFSSIFFLVLVLVLFEIGVYTDKKLSVREALALLLVYFLFLLTEFGLQLMPGKS